MGTRKADDEYFFRGIPLRTDHIEFIYPSSVSLRTLKSQINSYLVDRGSYKRSLFIWTLFVFPPLLLVSKFLLPIMNIVFVYVAFRIAGSWRAMTCANRVQLLLDNGRVKFTQSGDFQRAVREAADIVTQELRREVPGSEESSGTASFSDQSIPAPAVWQWDGKGDLHDEVILNLERDLKMHEWLRTYRRARMMSLIHGHAKQ
ncbi:hypothetical protein BC830DRAFT_147436 [Chytriomyces sp. MP71]|nr:hypothetical protein BC830DRAFT_147436 [Chytriomyces sp. MP71]